RSRSPTGSPSNSRVAQMRPVCRRRPARCGSILIVLEGARIIAELGAPANGDECATATYDCKLGDGHRARTQGGPMRLPRRRPTPRPSDHPKRPFNALAALGAAGHNGFERWAGIGVFLEPWLGRRATNILWSTALPLWFVQALSGRRRDEPMLAFNAGTAIAGAAVHYVEWPWSPRFGFLPW